MPVGLLIAIALSEATSHGCTFSAAKLVCVVLTVIAVGSFVAACLSSTFWTLDCTRERAVGRPDVLDGGENFRLFRKLPSLSQCAESSRLDAEDSEVAEGGKD